MLNYWKVFKMKKKSKIVCYIVLLVFYIHSIFVLLNISTICIRLCNRDKTVKFKTCGGSVNTEDRVGVSTLWHT